MKIRTQINGLLLLVIVFILIAFAIAMVAERKVETELNEMLRAQDLISNLENLRKITVETALLRDEIARDRWQYKLKNLQLELKRMAKSRPYAAAEFSQLNQQAEQARLAYLQFYLPDSNERRSNEAATVASLFATTEKMIEIGHDLIDHDRAETKEALHDMQLLSAIITIGFGLLIVFVWRLVRGDILRPLHEFQQGTERIAAGEYSHRLNLQQQDEIGGLAKAFDSMSARVEQTQGELRIEAENSRRAELALQESARYTQTILDNAIDGIITVDHFGIIQSANRAVERIFGYEPDAVIGQHLNLLLDSGYHADIKTCLNNPDNAFWSHEVEARHHEGHTFPMELALSQTDYRGQALFVGLMRDISERHRIEQMKSEFVSTVSHELRTPLTSIGGSLGLMVGGALGEVPAQMKAMLVIAHKNSLRLSHLIDDLLDMEKLVAGKFRFDLEVLPLMPLIEQSLEATRAYGENLKVSFWISERVDQVLVQVDGNRLQQVMANFLSNAAKFSPPGGQVQIQVSVHEERVKVAVIDHGPGIAAEFHQRIFQKFSQADSSDTRQKGGTGLGLAITKELIERMYGTVGFSTEMGKGSTFYFELPAIEPIRQSLDGLMQQRIEHQQGAAAHLLIVEDEPHIAELLAHMLQRAGYLVDVAYNGETALRYLAQHEYAAMTLDLMLPDQSGVTLIRQIRSNPRTAALPIIVVSAFAAEGKLVLNGEFNTIDWLKKPFEEQQLATAVARALEPHGTAQGSAPAPGAPAPGAAAPDPVTAKPPGRCRVLHIEASPDLSNPIRELGADLADFDHAGNLAQACEKLAQNTYQAVILDAGLPDGSGWTLLPQIRALNPPPALIVLSGDELSPEQKGAIRASLTQSGHSTSELLALLQTLSNKNHPAKQAPH